MVFDRMVGTGFVTEASGVHGDEGLCRAGDTRTGAEASMGRRPEQHIGRRRNQKGHKLSCNMLPVK
jgi:hypothetical protein